MCIGNELVSAIRTARIEKGLTQEELAEIIKITPTHIKHIESGHRKPSTDVLFALCRELSMSLDNVIFENNNCINRLIPLFSDCDETDIEQIIEIVRIVKKYKKHGKPEPAVYSAKIL